MATTRLTKETLYLRRDFTSDERLEMGRELAQGHNRLAAIDDEEKSMKATVKEKRTGVELMIGSLSRKLNDGYEMENQLCMLTYDQPNVGEVTYTDPSGKVVKTRPMTISERQEELPFEDKVEVIPPAVAEASAEASAENIENFFEKSNDPSAEDLDAVADEQAVAESTGLPADFEDGVRESLGVPEQFPATLKEALDKQKTTDTRGKGKKNTPAPKPATEEVW